ncbi:exonuclease 1 isoform X1 [Hylaeus anthracinus]|uniref:exonuclease 1 isoform X1 n=1 Tax=Hylaeus anthracinus TaxID=313031 RepID=UPI0023B9E0C0|nr:exonuclease 1 isoform X1 [Hylaeus anthracinus]
MGITGLLPFLEKSSKRTNINQFSGGTVAIDSYCWLHKGVFSCADKLQMGQQTDAYVHYCMKFVHMLLACKIKPILVFDGRDLPAKAQTEVKRREARQTNRRKGIELMKMGQHAEGRNLLRRSINITHEMALELIKHCQKMNVDCIVAPYEADAQLAYLNISGIADVVITEDSDLTLFGCKKVFFKMDVNGNGILVEQDRLHLAMDIRAEHFSMDNFRYMCILSGCDYLPSLPGIGLNKAKKFIMINTDCDIHRALTRLGSYLKMKSLVVTQEYRDAFILAVITFKHQLVFCPLLRKQVRLNSPGSDVTEEQLYYAGEETNPDIALQLALGNCDPLSLRQLHDFDPDKMESQRNSYTSWGQNTNHPEHISIWSRRYKLKENQPQVFKTKNLMTWPNPTGKEMMLQTSRINKAILVKQDNFECKELNQKEILNTYEAKDSVDVDDNSKIDVYSSSEGKKASPVLVRRTNPFSKELLNNMTSPSLLSKRSNRIKERNLTRIRRTIINEEIITESKFFSKSTNNAENSNIVANDDILCSSNNTNEVSREKETNNFHEMETESYPMDIDEDPNELLESNRRSNAELSNNYNNDIGSYLNVEISEPNSNVKSQEAYNLNNSLTLSHHNINSDFLIQQEDINNLSDRLFKWSDTESTVQVNNTTKHRKSTTNSGKVTNSNINMTNHTRRSQRLCPVRQQSLLSMYGFEKKKKM